MCFFARYSIESLDLGAPRGLHPHLSIAQSTLQDAPQFSKTLASEFRSDSAIENEARDDADADADADADSGDDGATGTGAKPFLEFEVDALFVMARDHNSNGKVVARLPLN